MALHGNRLTDKPLRIISIDPGSNKAGYAVMEMDFNTGKYKVLYCQTMVGNTLASTYFEKWLSDLHGDRIIKNLSHGLHLGMLLVKYKPLLVVAENSYVGKFVNAHKALMEHVTVLKMTCINYNKTMEFGMLSPSAVKKTVGVSGTSGDKTLMKNALLKRKDVSYAKGVNKAELDEHSIDSICIGITACKRIFANLSKKGD